RRISQSALILFIALLVAFPLVIVAKLASPMPIPRVTLPDPNGYDDLVAAGKMINSPILDTTREPKSTDELAAEIAKFSNAYDRIRLGLSRPCQVPVWPADGDPAKLSLMDMNDMTTLRMGARALMREAELDKRQERFLEAAKSSLDCIHEGQAATRGGMLIQYLVGAAIEG